jgi:hypothetical protein
MLLYFDEATIALARTDDRLDLRHSAFARGNAVSPNVGRAWSPNGIEKARRLLEADRGVLINSLTISVLNFKSIRKC